jgi:hypothetical protein
VNGEYGASNCWNVRAHVAGPVYQMPSKLIRAN